MVRKLQVEAPHQFNGLRRREGTVLDPLPIEGIEDLVKAAQADGNVVVLLIERHLADPDGLQGLVEGSGFRRGHARTQSADVPELFLSHKVTFPRRQGGNLIAQSPGVRLDAFQGQLHGPVEIPLLGLLLARSQSGFLCLCFPDDGVDSLLDHHLVIRDRVGDGVRLGRQEEEHPFHHPLAKRVPVVCSADLLHGPVHPVRKHIKIQRVDLLLSNAVRILRALVHRLQLRPHRLTEELRVDRDSLDFGCGGPCEEIVAVDEGSFVVEDVFHPFAGPEFRRIPSIVRLLHVPGHE